MFDWLEAGEALEGEFFLEGCSLHFTNKRFLLSYYDNGQRVEEIYYDNVQSINLRKKRNLLLYTIAFVVFLIPGSFWIIDTIIEGTYERDALEVGGVFLAIGIIYVILMKFAVKPELELTFNFKDRRPIVIEGKNQIENISMTLNRIMK